MCAVIPIPAHAPQPPSPNPMRLILAASFALATFVPGVIQAQTITTAETAIKTEYAILNGAVVCDAPVSQTYAVVDLGRGVRFVPWTSTNFNLDIGDNFCDEQDFTIAINRDVGVLNIDLASSIYFIPREAAQPALDGHVLNGTVIVTLPAEGLVDPFVRVDYYAPTSGSTPGPGFNARVGGNVVLELGSSEMQLNLSPQFLWDLGALGSDPGVLFQVPARIQSGPLFFETRLSTPIRGASDRETIAPFGAGFTLRDGNRR